MKCDFFFFVPKYCVEISCIYFFQPFLERRGDWTYCALAIRHLSQEDAGNYTVSVRNKYGEKSNHVRLSMKDQNEPAKYAISN